MADKLIPTFSPRCLDFGKILKKKNPFWKEFFNEFWVIVGEQEYIYIAEL